MPIINDDDLLVLKHIIYREIAPSLKLRLRSIFQIKKNEEMNTAHNRSPILTIVNKIYLMRVIHL